MTEVGFYHLTRTKLEQALPALLGRVLAQPEGRAVIRVAQAQRVPALDDLLWQVNDPPWLPHGTAQSGFGEWQPIWITDGDDVPNGARYLFLIDGAAADWAAFDRVFDLFDGADSAGLEAARARYGAARAAGHQVTYWKQGAKGWEKG